MKVKTEAYDVGVIIGRFQVPELHQAHIDLIQTVCDEHDKVLIFLGVAPLFVTRENPLDFEARKQMLVEKFPDVNVLYTKDQASDVVWSRNLDRQIADVVTPSQSVVLYGGRDSFQARYHGSFPTRELEQDVWISGTQIRRDVARSKARKSADFRAGVVWAAYSRFPTTYPTVDIAVFDETKDRLLLCRKPGVEQFQLIGGFADPGSPSFEADARREVQEEAGVAITDPVYVGSTVIEDWRYHNEVDKIKTLLFVATYQSGAIRPDDDVEEVRWFDIHSFTLRLDNIRPHHRALVQMALNAVSSSQPDTDKERN